MTRKHLAGIALWMGLALVDCSSGSNGSGSVPKLAWEQCDPNVYSAISDDMIKDLDSRLTCTKMEAPLDYNNPAKGTIQIALSRVAAESASERRGAIFFNPGGPGGDGLGFAPAFGTLWSIADKNDPLGVKFKELSQKYDLIGFSPRGVGSSTQLRCQLAGSFYLPTKFPQRGLLQNQVNIDANSKLTAQACQANPLTPSINSDATARDMDLARSLLGDQKLRYIGYSYGTRLGVWYAALFPTHVDKMVLDSNSDVTVSLPMAFSQQPNPLQYNVDNIIAHAAASGKINDTPVFNLGDVAAVRNIFPTLNDPMKQIVNDSLYLTLFSQTQAITSIEILAAANFISQFLQANPYATKEQLIAAVQTNIFSALEPYNTDMITISESQVAQYLVRNQQQPEVVSLSDSHSTNMAIKCNDMASPTDFNFWADLSDKLAATALIYGGGIMRQNCTSLWGGPTVSRPSLDNIRKAAPPILMVQDQYDAVTPLSGAIATYNALGIASMIYVTNDYSHTVFQMTNNGCVDDAVTSYLLTESAPSSQLLVCQGSGLFPNMNMQSSNLAEATGTQLPSALLAKAVYGNRVATSASFTDQLKAQTILQEISTTLLNAEKSNLPLN